MDERVDDLIERIDRLERVVELLSERLGVRIRTVAGLSDYDVVLEELPPDDKAV